MNDKIDYHFWWGVILTIGHVLLWLVLWLRKPGEEAQAALPAIEKRFSEALTELKELVSGEIADMRSAQRLIDERIRHLPVAREVDELTGDVRVVKKEVEALSKTQDAQTRTLERIEKYLLDRGQ